MSNLKPNSEYVYDSFLESLESKKINQSNKDKILFKGEYIFSEMIKTIGDNNRNKFLMVGKVQSGKTLNYISVIANAIKKGIKLFIILTSGDNILHDQTLERVQDELNYKANNNFLHFYTAKQIEQNVTVLSDIINNVDSDEICIITSLKNNVIGKFTNKLKQEKFFKIKQEKILIIDDEGDSASMTHTRKTESPTLICIKELTENTNSIYLSVTATPQVHLISSQKIMLYPHRVFCIDPGDGYIGLEFFAQNEDHFVILNENNNINNSNWYKTDEFKESLYYYIASISKYLQDNIFEKRDHSNMLIHTEIKNIAHTQYRQSINEMLEHLKCSIYSSKDDISFLSLKNKIGEINNKYNLNIKFDEDFLQYLNYAITSVKVEEINQNNNPRINEGFAKILVGSNLVGRGLTLDNLIVTFFTNRAKKITNIDTLLQRARWFGYRQSVIDKIKIFTTPKILDDFKEISRINEEIWLKLKKAEMECTLFKDIDKDIVIISQKLRPTGKAPMSRNVIKSRTYNNLVNEIDNEYSNASKLINSVKQSSNWFVASNEEKSKYTFKNVIFESFDDLYKIITRNTLINLLNQSSESFGLIENCAAEKKTEINVSLLSDIDDFNLPRTRDCMFVDNGYVLNGFFQGRSQNETPVYKEYIGDKKWANLKKASNKLFIQIHHIKPQYKDVSIEQYNEIYAFALLLPKDFENRTETKYSQVK